MSYKKTVVQLLDRPGGRWVLGTLATRVVRRADPDLQILYANGLWTRRAGSYFVPDGPKFDYQYEDFRAWNNRIEQYVSDAKDYWLRHYEPKEGDVIVDVGAGRGEDTFAFSQAVGETGRVIAIEAHPLSFTMLESFCRLNRLSNVTPLHLALMDKAGTVRVRESESIWSENAVTYDRAESKFCAPADTFDHLIQEQRIEKIDFLKMNIEGAERYALPGIASVMPRIRQICVACHDFRANLGHGEQFRTRAFAEQFLTEHGFSLASRAGDPRDYVRDHVFGLRSEARSHNLKSVGANSA